MVGGLGFQVLIADVVTDVDGKPEDDKHDRTSLLFTAGADSDNGKS